MVEKEEGCVGGVEEGFASGGGVGDSIVNLVFSVWFENGH